MSNILARNSALNIAAGSATTAGGFISNVIIARLLGVEGTGVVALALWFGMMAGTTMDLGASGALVRYLPELRNLQGDEISALIWFIFRRLALTTLAVCMGISVYVLWHWDGPDRSDFWSLRGDFKTEPLFWILVGLAGAAQGLTGFVTGYLQGAQRFRQLASIAVWSAALRLGGSVAFASWFGIAGAILAPVAASLAPIALLPTLLSSGRPPTSALFRRRIRRFMWGSWTSYVLTALVVTRMEIAFLQLNWGSAGVSLYAVGLTFANLATNGTLLLSGALLPYLSQLSPEDHAKAHAAFSDALRVVAFFVFPACLGSAAILPRLLPMVYGTIFQEAVPAAVLLVCSAAASAVTTVSFIYLMAMERTRFLFITGLVGTFLMIAAGLLIIPRFGPEGAALSRGFIIVTIASVHVWYITYELHCPVPFVSLGRLLAASVLCAFGARLALAASEGSASIALAILTGGFVFIGAIRLFGILEPSDAEKLKSVGALLPAPFRSLVEAAVHMLSAR